MEFWKLHKKKNHISDTEINDNQSLCSHKMPSTIKFSIFSFNNAKIKFNSSLKDQPILNALNKREQKLEKLSNNKTHTVHF